MEVLQPPRVAVCISDDLQFEQIVCRTSSCSILGGTRIFLCSHLCHRFISHVCPDVVPQRGHKNNTLIRCLDHKVGGLINCCVPDDRCRELKQLTDKNAIYKSSRRCGLGAPETKHIRLLSTLVGRTSNSGVCQVQAIWRGLFRSTYTMYDECSVFIDSTICFKYTQYQVPGRI